MTKPNQWPPTLNAMAAEMLEAVADRFRGAHYDGSSMDLAFPKDRQGNPVAPEDPNAQRWSLNASLLHQRAIGRAANSDEGGDLPPVDLIHRIAIVKLVNVISSGLPQHEKTGGVFVDLIDLEGRGLVKGKLAALKFLEGAIKRLRPATTPKPAIQKDQTTVGERPYRLQLALWQIKTHIREARAAVDYVAEDGPLPIVRPPAECDAVQAEITLKAHRALERMFKVLLGGAGRSGLWHPPRARGHMLSALYAKVCEAQPERVQALDSVYRRVAGCHDHLIPVEAFGQHLPVDFIPEQDGGFRIHLTAPESKEFIPTLESLCAWMDHYTMYGLSYLGDVFDNGDNEPMYFVHTNKCAPIIDFIEAAESEVIQDYAKPFLQAAEEADVVNPMMSKLRMSGRSAKALGDITQVLSKTKGGGVPGKR